MRAAAVAILALMLLAVSAASAAGMPSGTYCGSYMFFIKGRLSFPTSSELDFTLDVGGKKTTCDKEKYIVAPDGSLALPDKAKKGDCIGDLMSSNSLDTLNIKYEAGSNKIHLDAGVGSVTLERC
jgi:hypothetical protein